jgi:hypothetical protein
VEKKKLGNENFKGTVHITDCARSDTSGECGKNEGNENLKGPVPITDCDRMNCGLFQPFG